jgi:hypothetical protein
MQLLKFLIISLLFQKALFIQRIRAMDHHNLSLNTSSLCLINSNEESFYHEKDVIPLNSCIHSNVSSLSLKEHDLIYSQKLEYIENICSFPNLKELDISNQEIGDDEIKILSQRLPSLRCLKKLNCSYNKIGDKGAAILITGLYKLNSLEKLDLSHNLISNKGFHSLASLVNICPSLTLHFNGVDFQSLSYLRNSGFSYIAFKKSDEFSLDYRIFINQKRDLFQSLSLPFPLTHRQFISNLSVDVINGSSFRCPKKGIYINPSLRTCLRTIADHERGLNFFAQLSQWEEPMIFTSSFVDSSYTREDLPPSYREKRYAVASFILLLPQKENFQETAYTFYLLEEKPIVPNKTNRRSLSELFSFFCCFGKSEKKHF